MSLPRTLIDPKIIYLEPAVRDYERGREVLARFPAADLVEVASHWKIAQLADPALAEDWLKVKRDTLVLGIKKGMQMRPNGRSADFIAPSSSNGCARWLAHIATSGGAKATPIRSACSSTSRTSRVRWRATRRS
jgi:hypothetical protein